MASLITIGKGYLFADRYQIGALLGKGGMGTVYEAVHLPTARRRALKIMSYQLAGGASSLRQRFTREAQLGARIGSPFIVDVLDAGVDELTGLPFIAMERLHGEDLAFLSNRAGPLPASNVVRYLHQAAQALQSCHAAGVIHRDIKPSNLFLAERGEGERAIKLLDLGIAKVVVDGEALTTESIGTPAYMAPEQLSAGGKVTPATDSYALAMVAYTLLAGRGYFQDREESAGVFAFADAIRAGVREPASERARRAGVTLPPALDVVFSRSTAASPADRYPSVVDTVAALADALGEPLPSNLLVWKSSADEADFVPSFEAGTPPPATVSTIAASTGGGEVARNDHRRARRAAWLILATAALSAMLISVVAVGRSHRGPRAGEPMPAAPLVERPSSVPPAQLLGAPVPTAEVSAASGARVTATAAARLKRQHRHRPPARVAPSVEEPNRETERLYSRD